MTQLSKTDEKIFGAILPHLDKVQKFVDDTIQGSNTMTAAAIGDKLKAEVGLDEDTFVKSFRIAVRLGKITGIESAKRFGYRRAGAVIERTSSAESVLDDIEPYLNDLQVFVDRHIQGVTRMTAAVIYNKFKAEKDCSLDEEEFIKLFRLAIREGRITGLESAYRFGYRREGTGSPVSDDNSVDEEEKAGHNNAEILIDERRRIVALDRFNWGYQIRRDSGSWHTEAYFSNTTNLVRGIARKLLDDELKNMNRFNLKELFDKIEEAENRLTVLLRKALGSEESQEAPPEEVQDAVG